MKRADKTRAQLLGELRTLEVEHRRAQATIQERERLYQLLVENSLGLMCSHDLDGVLLSINPAAARSLGYRPDDGIGRSLRDFLAPSVRPLFDDYLARIRENHRDSGLMRLVARDGRERVWAYRNVLYEDPETAPCVLGHALDVTERIGMEQALKRARRELERRVAERTAELERGNQLLQASEARFRALSERASDLVSVLKADFRCSYASPSHQHILGYLPGELEGRGVLELVHPDDRPQATAAFAEGLAQPGPFVSPPLELRVRHADGSWRVLSLSAANCLDDPAVHGVIINAHDVTLRARAEEERNSLLRREQEARAQAEAAVRVRDEFLTAAAHDLRTPLTVIIGHGEMMRAALDSGQRVGAEWLHRHLTPVAQAAARVLATVEDITDAAQLQIGQPLLLHTNDVDIAEMVRAAITTVEASVPRRAAAIMTRTMAVTVQGDRMRLERVLHNIVGNALKYSSRGAPIHVEVSAREGWAVITVRDRGVGIPAEELPRLFTQFYRASTARGIPGKGIGLAGAKAIVEQHGGRIEIASAVGQGTTVTVFLPQCPPAANTTSITSS